MMECKHCGVYMKGGPDVCETCSDFQARIDRLTTENADLQQRLDADEGALLAAREEVVRLLEFYHSLGYADAPCSAHSMPSLLAEDCAVCRADKAESALTAANSRVERYKDALDLCAAMVMVHDIPPMWEVREIACKALADDAKEAP